MCGKPLPAARHDNLILLHLIMGKRSTSNLERIVALPQPLLDWILIKETTKADKRALRQTCKVFQTLLDGGLVSCRIQLPHWEYEYTKRCLENFLKRTQHVASLRAVVLLDLGWNERLIKHLPDHLHTLAMPDYWGCVKELSRLRCLKTLCVGHRVTGMKYVSGLTYLEFHHRLTDLKDNVFLGSVAHLAPTLKHLSFRYSTMEGLSTFTNLEVLEVCGHMPSNFFQLLGKVPLKHLSFLPVYGIGFCGDQAAWKLAPTTLTCLTLDDQYPLRPIMLPPSITHLKLGWVRPGRIKQAAAALPHLMRLDVSLHISYHSHDWSSEIMVLSKLTKLETLSIRLPGNDIVACHREQVLSALHGLASAVERGVRLSVLVDWDGIRGFSKSV